MSLPKKGEGAGQRGGSVFTMSLFIYFSFALDHLRTQSVALCKMKLAVLIVAGFCENVLAGSPAA